MASTFRQYTAVRFICFAAFGLAVVASVVYFSAWRSGGDVLQVNSVVPPLQLKRTYSNIREPDPHALSVLFSSSATPSVLLPVQPSPSRYRLAGTFAVESENGQRRLRAIVDDAITGEQHIAGEGERLTDASVTRISRDRVTLQTALGPMELTLDFIGAPVPENAASITNTSASLGLESNRFGCIKVRDDRWQFNRQPLLDYYQELLDEPNRMVALFDSLKPVRDANNRITGYILGVEGEKEFFDSVGLSEGDIIRQVNSVPMTNRRRAEFFIDEFLKNRMNAIVLEVERAGQRTKQVYQLRE